MKHTILFTLIMIFTFSCMTAAEPVDVNASDIIGKVYGITAPSCNQVDCRQAVAEHFGKLPCKEDGGEWLTSDEGLILRYSSMSPEVDAMARYENGKVAGFGYIFYFPYEAHCRKSANSSQCEFCRALIQELADMDVYMVANPMTDSLFEISGEYNGNDISLILREEIENENVTANQLAGTVPADRSGQFVLLVSVVPETYNLTAVLAE
ncbi:MAG: hypothetical protein K2J15_00405 [Muribaculaceae bacterium]|nr:hypothetical protein [Muribaculaceae bacterium]